MVGGNDKDEILRNLRNVVMEADTFPLYHNGLWHCPCTLAKDLTPTKMSVLYKSTHTAQIILPSVAGGGVGVAESAESSR